jgi:hypothetical protein
MFFKDDESCVADLITLDAIQNDLGPELGLGLRSKSNNDITSAGPINNHPHQLGVRVTWNRDPL